MFDMTETVKVLSSPLGEVIRVSRNPGYGFIVVSQLRCLFDQKGSVRQHNITACVMGPIHTLEELKWQPNQVLPGKIVIHEATAPFRNTNPMIDLKFADRTLGLVCTVGGLPIYRKTYYSVSDTVDDVLVPHDNGNDIHKIRTLAHESQSARARLSEMVVED